MISYVYVVNDTPTILWYVFISLLTPDEGHTLLCWLQVQASLDGE